MSICHTVHCSQQMEISHSAFTVVYFPDALLPYQSVSPKIMLEIMWIWGYPSALLVEPFSGHADSLVMQTGDLPQTSPRSAPVRRAPSRGIWGAGPWSVFYTFMDLLLCAPHVSRSIFCHVCHGYRGPSMHLDPKEVHVNGSFCDALIAGHHGNPENVAWRMAHIKCRLSILRWSSTVLPDREEKRGNSDRTGRSGEGVASVPGGI